MDQLKSPLLIIVISVIGILMIGGGLWWYNSNRDTEDKTLKNAVENTNGATDQAENSRAESCGTEPEFTAAFTDLENIEQIGPVGALDGGSHGRSYVQLKPGVRTAVYAPADATLEHIVYSRRDPALEIGEYGIYLRTACGVMILLDHLDEVTNRMVEYAPKTMANNSGYSGTVIGDRVTAGELLAYSDGTAQARTFDFYVQDENKPVAYINSARWKWNQNLYAQCPYDLYPAELQARFYGLFPEPNRSDKNCGQVSYDQAGTAAGGWFVGDDTDVSGVWLTFGTYTNYSALTIRRDGARDFSVRDYRSKLKPSEMKPGDQVCYDYEGRWAFAKLISSEELQVATGQGSCPTEFPATGVVSYVR